MKLLVSAKTDDFTSYIQCGANGFLLPLQGYATDYQKYYTQEEISNLKEKYPNVSFFVVFNEMIFNEQIKEVEKILLFLEKISIDGIFFYDFALYQLHQKLHLKVPLVWNQTHMVTNKETADLLYEKKVSYGVLSSEITYSEIKKMTESKMQFFLPLVGYMSVGVSRRLLLTNFYKKKREPLKKSLSIQEENSKIPFLVQEGENGVSIFSGKCLNIAPFWKEICQMKIPYGILKEDFLPHDDFLKVLSLYANEKDFTKLKKETGNLIGRNTGFLARKTMFRIKKAKK